MIIVSKTAQVKVTKAFYVEGKLVEADTVLTLPGGFAAEVVSARKAVFVRPDEVTTKVDVKPAPDVPIIPPGDARRPTEDSAAAKSAAAKKEK